jgi:hypothetical protein
MKQLHFKIKYQHTHKGQKELTCLHKDKMS